MMNKSVKSTASSNRGAKTRERLLETSIELFARHGIQGVSLRTVMEAAGAKNTAAVHYHFGDREALLEAALDCVVSAATDSVSLSDAEAYGFSFAPPADDRLSELRMVMTVAMLPVITLPHRKKWGADGVKLLARIVMGEAQDLAPRLESMTFAESEQLMALVGDYIPFIPEDIRRTRIDFIYINLICGIAALPYLSAVENAGLVHAKQSADLARALIDYMLGGLTAPVAPLT
jgi:AcrR family transcriptional regulator